jgi:hypothetical protein
MAREKGKGGREAKGTGNNSNRWQHRHCYIEKGIRNGIKARKTRNTYLHSVHGGGREGEGLRVMRRMTEKYRVRGNEIG